MKKAFIVFILIVNSFIAFAQEIEEFYFKFVITSHDELEMITRLISIDNVINDTVYAYANQEQLEAFRNLDYKLEFIKDRLDDMKAYTMAGTLDEMSNWDRYPIYELYVEMMQNFATSYPDICKLDTIGESKYGRLLLAVKISDNVSVNEEEPEFFYTGTMHGNETTGYILLLRLIDSLLVSYGQSSQITSLIDDNEIFINPLANPDGTYAGGNNTITSATRSNGNGVDLNRNFPDPDNGPNPDGNPYQPETIAMMDYAEKNHFVLSANFHGGAEVVNYPWDTFAHYHPDTEWFKKISLSYAEPAIANSPSGYFQGISSTGIIKGYNWYPTYGNRQDYMTYYHHCREVTIEVSDSKLLPTEYLNNYWNYNKESLFAYMREVQYGIKGTIKNILNEPVHSEIFIKNLDTSLDSSMVHSDPGNGFYIRLLDSGRYDLIFSAEGFDSVQIEDTLLNFESSATIDLILLHSDRKTIIGEITNSMTNLPVSDMKVIFSETLLDTLYSDANGKFTTQLPDGEYTVQMMHKDYVTSIHNISISPNDTIFHFSVNSNPCLILSKDSVSYTLMDDTVLNDTLWIKSNQNEELNFQVEMINKSETNWISKTIEAGTTDTTVYPIDYEISTQSLQAGYYEAFLLFITEFQDTTYFKIKLTIEESTFIEPTRNLNSSNIYPNPFDEYFIIALPENTGNLIRIDILNMEGQLVENAIIHVNTGEKTIKYIPSRLETRGLYFIKISYTHTSVSYKVFKE